jgi:hypothetical protein
MERTSRNLNDMFRCDKCNTVVPAGTSAHQLVVKKRTKTYPPRTREVAKGRRYRAVQTIDPGGKGHETVQELKVCQSCAESWTPDADAE